MQFSNYLHLSIKRYRYEDRILPAHSNCSKEVIDFSLLSDAEVLNYFKRSTGNTCGRFTSDQLQRPLQETKIEKKKGWQILDFFFTTEATETKGVSERGNSL